MLSTSSILFKDCLFFIHFTSKNIKNIPKEIIVNFKKLLLPLLITAVASPSILNAATFVMEKNNQSFSIDGAGGAQQGQQIYLWGTNTNNANQQWDQIDHGDGYYSYRKYNTNLCWDGGDDGARRQAVTLETCDSSDLNQHWAKIKMVSGTEIYRFEKRNAPGFSIDGNGGGENLQAIYLWNSNDNNVNQQWDLIRTDEGETASSDTLYLQHANTGLYYTTNATGQLILTASSTSNAQGLEKVSNGGGFSIRAVGGDLDGNYSYEPNGGSRQELTANLANAEIFFENSCDGDDVYFTSGTTGDSLKNESNNMLGNGSGGSCSDDANVFTWAGTGNTSTTPPTTITPPSNSGNADVPSDLMRNVDQWKITLPDGEEIKQLEGVENEYFYVNNAGDGIVFYAPVRSDNGTTPNSDNIRSELREREEDGSVDIYWTTDGTHVLYVDQAITHLPIEKPHLVATQIHGDKDAGIDDAMVLRLENNHLFLSFNGNKLRDDLTIKTNYQLGTRHEVIFEVINGRHYVYYSEDGNLGSAYLSGNASQYLVRDGNNDYVMDIDYDQAYFKVGNYTQSNAEEEGDRTDDSDNYGEVVVYDFWAEHP